MQVNVKHLDALVRVVNGSTKLVSGAIIIAALLLASSFLVDTEGKVYGVINVQSLGITGYIVSGILGVWLLVAMIRGREL